MKPDLLPINEIARKLGVPDQYFEQVGRYGGKVKLGLLDDPAFPRKGKLILVTATTPTVSGEGKTVTSIGLTQGLEHVLRGTGKRVVLTSREPSLGPVFGMKGGAAGGGRSQVEPSEKINLHFHGDFHAITSAHNLLSALLDAHIFHGNDLQIDPATVTWPRALDMNDRGLRRITTNVAGPKKDGSPARAGSNQAAGFVITAASEVMAILALATENAELRAAFQAFVGALEEHCRGIVRHQLDVATSAYAAKPASLSALSLADDDDCEENVPPAPTQILHDRWAAFDWQPQPAGVTCMAEESQEEASRERCAERERERNSNSVADTDMDCVRMQGHDGSEPDDGARDAVTRGAGQQQARPAAAGLLPDHRSIQSHQQPGAVPVTRVCPYGDDKAIITCLGTAINMKHRNGLRAMVAELYMRAKAEGLVRQVNKTYSSVCAMAERHFMAIRRSVAAEEAPATLKAAFLEPISRRLPTDLSVHLFARTDQHFMTWFACAASNNSGTTPKKLLASTEINWHSYTAHFTTNQLLGTCAGKRGSGGCVLQLPERWRC